VAWHALPVRLDIVVAQLLDTIARLRCRERPDCHGADFALLGRFALHLRAALYRHIGNPTLIF
jgi:hypothetical protein